MSQSIIIDKAPLCPRPEHVQTVIIHFVIRTVGPFKLVLGHIVFQHGQNRDTVRDAIAEIFFDRKLLHIPFARRFVQCQCVAIGVVDNRCRIAERHIIRIHVIRQIRDGPELAL